MGITFKKVFSALLSLLFIYISLIGIVHVSGHDDDHDEDNCQLCRTMVMQRALAKPDCFLQRLEKIIFYQKIYIEDTSVVYSFLKNTAHPRAPPVNA